VVVLKFRACVRIGCGESVKNSFLFLGTGSSVGIPVIACRCAVCLSSDSCNCRSRTSGLLKIGKKRILIDPGPDYRQQALRFGIDRLDGVLVSHVHFDHIGGFEELRVYGNIQDRSISCLLSYESLKGLQQRIPYFFSLKKQYKFSFQIIEQDICEVDFEGEFWQIITYRQGGMKVTGFRWRNFAYMTDLKTFSDNIYASLAGVEVLVISALRHTDSPAHLSMEESIVFAQRVGAKNTWFSHVAHDLDHNTTNQKLPSRIQLAYDGLEIDVN
jgi:phosphoribosyl 1,2-cyclic phosphate phosphodiesterase